MQGFLGRQYDIVETSMISIPRAVERGLNVSLLFTALGRLSPGPTLDIWVKRDSPVQSVQELKGKKIAVFGLGSTALSMIRVALAKEHGFNVELQGGDFQFVELPTAIIPAAMERGETRRAVFSMRRCSRRRRPAITARSTAARRCCRRTPARAWCCP